MLSLRTLVLLSVAVVAPACLDAPSFESAASASDDGEAERSSDGDAGEATAVDASAAPPSPSPGGTGGKPDAGGTNAPPTPPAPPANGCASKVGVCCGTVACIGCSNPESGDCRECEEACAPGEVCCKKGGPPRCRAPSHKKGNGHGNDKGKHDDDC